MGWRGTLILGFVVVVVGAYVWLEEPPSSSSPTTAFLGDSRALPTVQMIRPLLIFKPDEIVSVRVEQEGQVRAAERSGKAWAGCDEPDVVDDVLRNLSHLGVLAEIPAAPDELADYGLQPPRTVVELRQRDRPVPLVLQIGDRNPATTGVYVRIGDHGDVALAGALVAWEVDKLFGKLADGGH